MPFPWKIHRQTPLKMIEPRKTALLSVKKTTTTTKTERISWQHEWKNIRCMLYKADTPRLRSTMQNICFLISISAVTLKLISNSQNHIHLRSRRENAHLLVNPIPKLTMVLIWKTPPCLKFGNTELRGACASSEKMDLRTLEFRLTSTRCPSATSEWLICIS